MTHAGDQLAFAGRREELHRLRTAMKNRESLLIWGPADSGKTALAMKAIEQFPEAYRSKCIYCSAPGSIRDLLSQIVLRLSRERDPCVREKLFQEGEREEMPENWLRKQTSLRLRGIAFRAMERERYWIFLDHVPAASRAMARLMKEFVWRCKTPVYLLARGKTEHVIGRAWSLYWTDEFRIGLPPLNEFEAGRLFEKCVLHFGLADFYLDEFRQEVLRRSSRQPGSIVKMCELAANPRYQHGEQIKIKLVHVDYLMRTNPGNLRISPDLSP